MEGYRRLLQEYWPKIALFAGLGAVLFFFFGKFFLWFFAKSIVKIAGLALIGIGLLFGKFKNQDTATNS